MPVSLTQPAEGSVGWAAAVNQNFQDIETAINSGGGGGGGVAAEVGAILMWHHTTPPTGWLLCDGAAVSRTTYADLFAVVGTAWGAGDGSTTFNLPNFTGRSPMGVDIGGSGQITTAVSQAKGESTHTMTTGELVSHDHSLNDPGHVHNLNLVTSSTGSDKGIAVGSYDNSATILASSGYIASGYTGASIASAGSSTPFNVVHPVRGTYFVIRYQATTSGPSASVFADNNFRVQDDGDATKQVALDVSGVTTATTRTLTVPNSNGTIALTSQLPGGAALTKVDDTNVTLTLGGTPSTALLQAASVTAGWTGQLAPARGGTGLASYTAGDLLYASGAATLSKLGIGTANQLLRTNSGATAPEWASLSTLLDTIGSTRGSLLYRGVSGWAAVTPGTSGHVLTSNGAGSDPTYQASAGGGSGASFDSLALTAATTSITTSDEGKVLNNTYATAAAEADLPTGLGTGATDALLFPVVDYSPATGAADNRVILDPGANGLFMLPGALHAQLADKIATLDENASGLWWGRRDVSNSYDLWYPLSLLGRWCLASKLIVGNSPNVNPMNNQGTLIATASGTFVRGGDMGAITITDPAGLTDGQDNEQGYYVAAGHNGTSTMAITEGATCPARFGGGMKPPGGVPIPSDRRLPGVYGPALLSEEFAVSLRTGSVLDAPGSAWRSLRASDGATTSLVVGGVVWGGAVSAGGAGLYITYNKK